MSSSADSSTDFKSTYTITIAGQAISEEIDVQSVETHFELSCVPSATIKIAGGNLESEQTSAAEMFVPGAKVKIQAGYSSAESLIFKGVVTSQSMNMDSDRESILTVECRDESVRLTIGRKNKSFAEMTDGEIMAEIVSGYPELDSELVATDIRWPSQMQSNATDWDFLLSRADANGLIVSVVNGKVKVMKPDTDTESVLRLEVVDLREMHLDLNSIHQLDKIRASAWDLASQAMASSTASTKSIGPGKLHTPELSGVAAPNPYEMESAAHLNSEELTQWAEAEAVKSEYSRIRGTIKFQGSALVLPGTYLTLDHVGALYSGKHLVAAVRHFLAEGNWVTEAALGLSPEWHTHQHNEVTAPPAAGLIPGIRGLAIGTVQKIAEDPDQQYRILVRIPMIDPQGEGLWARMAGFYASGGAGAFFFPEIGDEVILGFLGEDPRFPVILGSVYSSPKHEPGASLKPDKSNSKKAIVSREGVKIVLDDADKKLTLETPGGNKIEISDYEMQIKLRDQNGNSVQMSSEGLELKSYSKILIDASSNVIIRGAEGVSIESYEGNLEFSGINIEQTASVEYRALGSAIASVTGGAELKLKGGIVMIN